MTDGSDDNRRAVHSVTPRRSDSRVHGAIAGGLCSGVHAEAHWQQLFGAVVGTPTPGVRLQRVLELTEVALADPDCSFEPLLPAEDEPLPVRVAALADWCDAFVLAFVAGRDAGMEMSRDDGELLGDLEVIAARLETDANGIEEEDEGEDDFMQLVEYVRVAVLNLFASRAHTPGR